MADAITVSGPISGTDRTLSFPTGKLAGQADGAVVARIGDTIVLATATAARKVPRGNRLFPPDRRHRRADVRRRQDPRLVLPAGGQGDRPGDPDLPA